MLFFSTTVLYFTLFFTLCPYIFDTAADLGAKESISNLNLGELNLDELDKKIAQVVKDTEQYMNSSPAPPPPIPPNGLFLFI